MRAAYRLAFSLIVEVPATFRIAHVSTLGLMPVSFSLEAATILSSFVLAFLVPCLELVRVLEWVWVAIWLPWVGCCVAAAAVSAFPPPGIV